MMTTRHTFSRSSLSKWTTLVWSSGLDMKSEKDSTDVGTVPLADPGGETNPKGTDGERRTSSRPLSLSVYGRPYAASPPRRRRDNLGRVTTPPSHLSALPRPARGLLGQDSTIKSQLLPAKCLLCAVKDTHGLCRPLNPPAGFYAPGSGAFQKFNRSLWDRRPKTSPEVCASGCRCRRPPVPTR